ncbi:uncharacterized protein LOC119113478 [Pollicipes pollicipes]|uniref:uncharacterized protein LOC119113478 n=1 Tax=Pollicipes pollicipes TaxID=41117 RepID=UPI001884D801|nr:uncharacterized protein LOC119113478 [Pollicipes pollicipes]
MPGGDVEEEGEVVLQVPDEEGGKGSGVVLQMPHGEGAEQGEVVLQMPAGKAGRGLVLQEHQDAHELVLQESDGGQLVLQGPTADHQLVLEVPEGSAGQELVLQEEDGHQVVLRVPEGAAGPDGVIRLLQVTNEDGSISYISTEHADDGYAVEEATAEQSHAYSEHTPAQGRHAFPTDQTQAEDDRVLSAQESPPEQGHAYAVEATPAHGAYPAEGSTRDGQPLPLTEEVHGEDHGYQTGQAPVEDASQPGGGQPGLFSGPGAAPAEEDPTPATEGNPAEQRSATVEVAPAEEVGAFSVEEAMERLMAGQEESDWQASQRHAATRTTAATGRQVRRLLEAYWR